MTSTRGTYRWKRVRKTHCMRGHPLSGDNVIVRVLPNCTKQRCMTCNKMYGMKRRAKEQAHDNEGLEVQEQEASSIHHGSQQRISQAASDQTTGRIKVETPPRR